MGAGGFHRSGVARILTEHAQRDGAAAVEQPTGPPVRSICGLRFSPYSSSVNNPQPRQQSAGFVNSRQKPRKNRRREEAHPKNPTEHDRGKGLLNYLFSARGQELRIEAEGVDSEQSTSKRYGKHITIRFAATSLSPSGRRRKCVPDTTLVALANRTRAQLTWSDDPSWSYCQELGKSFAAGVIGH
jgi:hypothetical protein